MDRTNASVIVSGGAGGFGSATVRRLAQMGAKVVIADVSDKRGEALAREVGAGSLSVPTDCMDEDAIAKAVKAAVSLGPLGAAVQTSPRSCRANCCAFVRAGVRCGVFAAALIRWT